MPSVGHAELEDRRVGERRPLRVDRGRPAREDERDGVARADLLGAEPVRDELRVDARLAHAPRDELAVLAAEVEDEHRASLRGGLGRGELQGLSLGGNWAHPS